ncbi:cytochrome P450 [Actinokineospora sp. HUAS TT18]|uniref:cytochrome P450 n=1 Tax=Actinokineospora sp. HUAS TT18 TaxID=3447451 RepID=UPI003F51EAC8
MHDQTPSDLVAAMDPSRAAFHQDPYPVYAEARSGAPVAYVPSTGIWVISGSAEAEEALRDTQRFCNRYNLHSDYPLSDECLRVLENSHFTEQAIFNVDPPDHARMRGLLTPWFGRSNLSTKLPLIERVVGDLIDGFIDDGQVDLQARLAYPAPMTLVCNTLGVPVSDHMRLRELCDQWVALLALPLSDEDQIAAAHSVVELDAYCGQLLSTREQSPEDDIATELARSVRIGRATRGEAIAIIRFLLFAAHESTKNMIVHTVHNLLRDRPLWEAVVNDPALIPNALEEGLRFEPPIQGMTRQTTTEVTIGGVTIPPSARVHVIIGAVARDPARTPEPDRFDIGRPNGARHLAFGLGAHYCVGAPLARQVGRVVLEHLVARIPGLSLRKGFTPRFTQGGYIFHATWRSA